MCWSHRHMKLAAWGVASDARRCRQWRRLHRHLREPPPQLVREIEASPARSCGDFAPSPAGQHRNNRALSPWRYRVDYNSARRPERIVVAECLCDGCIIHGEHDTGYNSVPVRRTMLVLWAEPCGGGGLTYAAREIEVAVACTCVVPALF
ncbi:interleukin-17C [Denticeps clupeoides]|uniref:interleukin-17C n=1 Tax=Denticeps clupeoides TaxID=299321 RepID=UPI0010A2E7FC|nr:interleukin-17C-like [Denticeps clupeoides]